MVQLAAGGRIDPFAVELGVDRVGTELTGVTLAPGLPEPLVVLAPAERTRAMPGGKRGRLVEEEELREATRLHEGVTSPTPKPEPAGDPPLAVVAPADAPGPIV